MEEVCLRSGTRGRLEISLDDGPVFSKARLNRFPREGEIVKLLESALGPAIDWR